MLRYYLIIYFISIYTVITKLLYKPTSISYLIYNNKISIYKTMSAF